jgi:hypothetical protein
MSMGRVRRPVIISLALGGEGASVLMQKENYGKIPYHLSKLGKLKS